jgi:site-specific recombinase XerC
MTHPAATPDQLATLALPGCVDARVLAATAGWLREHADAPNTQRAYLRDLAAWIDWCTTAQIDLSTARRPDADAWIDHLATTPSPATGRPLATSSRARALATVSSWYRYLLSLDEDLVARNPIAAVHRPTVDAHHSAAIGLTASQARALIALLGFAGLGADEPGQVRAVDHAVAVVVADRGQPAGVDPAAYRVRADPKQVRRLPDPEHRHSGM